MTSYTALANELARRIRSLSAEAASRLLAALRAT